MKKYNCPVFQAADIVGKKWAIVLLQEIVLHGDKGFVFLENRIPKISPKVLTQRLQELEAFGIVNREVVQEGSIARTKYSLTEKGEDLYKVVLSLRGWKTKYANDNQDCCTKECVNCELL